MAQQQKGHALADVGIDMEYFNRITKQLTLI